MADQQPSLWDETPPYQRHSQTSYAAARQVASKVNRLQATVLAVISASDGLTDEEGIEATGLSPSTYRPRRVELVNKGLVADSGEKRKTYSGCLAVVWDAH